MCRCVITRYNRIKADPQAEWVPRVVIFASKARVRLPHGKQIIHLINDVAKSSTTSADRRQTKGVHFPTTGVSLAQTIDSGADLSGRISLAGTSGTSNEIRPQQRADHWHWTVPTLKMLDMWEDNILSSVIPPNRSRRCAATATNRRMITDHDRSCAGR